MRKIAFILILLIVLSGCSGAEDALDRAMELRTSLLNGEGCSFSAQITADFSEATYTFTLDCKVDDQGELSFTVQEPSYIQGITGLISGNTGKLTFDGNALTFPLQADGVLSPVSGPWVVIRALRSGYIRSCGLEDGLWRITVNDSYEEDALTVDIWVDGDNGLVQADIYEDNRRIMAICVTNFQLQ